MKESLNLYLKTPQISLKILLAELFSAVYMDDTVNKTTVNAVCFLLHEKQEELTEAGRAVQGHIPDDSGTKTRPHKQELLGHLLQAPGPLPRHLERTFPWEKRGEGWGRQGRINLRVRIGA